MGAKDQNDKSSIFNRWEDNKTRTIPPEEVERRLKKKIKKENQSTKDTK